MSVYNKINQQKDSNFDEAQKCNESILSTQKKREKQQQKQQYLCNWVTQLYS